MSAPVRKKKCNLDIFILENSIQVIHQAILSHSNIKKEHLRDPRIY